ncbi:hypothetical protein BH18VER1_BH18VER1_13830 [soil metagenome]
MKKSKIIARAALIVATAGALSLSTSVLAQEDQERSETSASTESSTTTDAMAGPTSSPAKSERKRSAPTKAKAGASPAAGGTATSKSDEQFLKTAAKGGMMEVHMGQMAQQEGQSAEVKKLGERIAADHTKANNQLMAIAQKKGMKLDTRHSMDKMSTREKANFDQAWLAMMVTDHRRDIADFQAEAQNGTDPEVKAFARKTLPVLQKHLKMVQAAQKKVGSSAPAAAGSPAATKSATPAASASPSGR